MPIFNISHGIPLEDYNIMTRWLINGWFSGTVLFCNKDYYAPILAVVISEPGFASISDTYLKEWWLSPPVLRTELPLDIQSRVQIVETTDWQAIPNIVKDHFGFSLDDGTLGTSICLPSWPEIEIQLEHLGTTKQAGLGFVKDCLHGFSAYNKPIHVWCVSRPTYPAAPEDTLNKWASKVQEDVLRYEDLILIQATLDIPEDAGYRHGVICRLAESASHVYIEYEGLVYDGIVAFDKPVPLEEYQAKLNATYQERITILPGTDLDAAYQHIVARRNYVGSLTKT
jgi:hypothetical protein